MPENIPVLLLKIIIKYIKDTNITTYIYYNW